MLVVMFVVFGLASLAAFCLMGWMLNQNGWAIDAARVFIGVWLVAALLNSAVGVVYAGISPLNEAGAFIAIFGIPAAAAWFLSRRYRAAR